MIESIVIILPLPHNCLSPNARTHWAAKAGATKKARKLACEHIEALELDSTPWGTVEATEAFYFKTNRRRDERNQVAMLKAYYDGFTDAGLMLDDDFETLSHGKPTFHQDKNSPRVEITLTRK
jgi:crossover junction endodeoxyribonuclease RusA